MMSLKELYELGKKSLVYPEECTVLTEEFFGADRGKILREPGLVPENQEAFLQALSRRRGGEPLQYILGHWQFDSMDLKLSEGVLIPREDTMVLVEAAREYIGSKQMQGLDLCAGTGAVGLAVARHCKNASIAALELYDIPFSCLQENIRAYGQGRVSPKRQDVLLDPQEGPLVDFILSNPPYIAKAEIPLLQAEVRLEPEEALNGGEDGLLFYRALGEKWVKALKPGGLMAVEIGESQGHSVKEIMAAAGLGCIEVLKDMNGLNRVVRGIKA